jgi:glucose/arabinose dehydrogenase
MLAGRTPRWSRARRRRGLALCIVLVASLLPAVVVASRSDAATSPAVALEGTPGGNGYWIALADGRVLPFGDAAALGSLAGSPPATPVVDLEARGDGAGYWLVTSAGVVSAFGSAVHHGDLTGFRLNAPIVGVAPLPDGSGYWLLGGDGGIFSFGAATFYGSTGAMRLNQPVVGMAATPSGHGYWLVASDGGIFSFGDAVFHGSTGAMRLNQPVVGMAPSATGAGYWLVASDGGVFSFGDAVFAGSTGNIVLAAPIVGMDAPPGASAYRMVAVDGGVFAFDLPFLGSGTTDPLAVQLTRVATLGAPTAMAVRPGDDTLYVAEQVGRVQAIRGGTVSTVLDIRSLVRSGGEQGLLGIAFSPDGSRLYVHYSRAGSPPLGGDTAIFEYQMGATTADPATGREILRVDQPYDNHNGGQIAFGADGFLYIGLGDGGSVGDPQNRALRLDNLLGKILRIDPLGATGGAGYAIPPSNPFVGTPGAQPEIWSYGLRNPWRFSFDRVTGDLWIADVGQGAIEEVDLTRGGVGGRNYGWDRWEGSQPYDGGPPLAQHDLPVLELSHSDGYCSITGGSVYRGTAIPALVGAYLFTDFCHGNIEAIRVPTGTTVTERVDLGVGQVAHPSSFGVDNRGEVYVLSHDGPIYRIDPA